MKKLLAVLLSLVMALTFMMPTFAANEDIATTEDSSISESISGVVGSTGDLSASLDAVTDAFSFIENLFAAIHGLVHNLSVMFDFDCPFDSVDKDEKPSKPEEPSEPDVPSDPVEIVPDEDWYDTQSSYIITTAEEFAAFANAVNTGISFAGETVTLGADIDLSGKIWEPIGNYDYVFDGTFDGKDHTISNLYINAPEGDALALFGVAQDATIKDINVKNVDITGYEMVAAIVAYPYKGCTISDCHVSGDISIVAEYTHAGGIASIGSVNIEDCSVIADEMGKIAANERNIAGGIIGYNSIGETAITNCQVKNMEITAWANVGAIAGLINLSNTIDSCVAENITLTKTREDGHPTIGLAAGGFVYNASKSITITNNLFKNITLVGKATTVSSANVMYGAEYSGKTTSNFVMEGNSAEDINLGLLYN